MTAACALLCGLAMSGDPFAGLAALPDAALAEARGGLSVGGYEIEFGVVIETTGARSRLVSTAPSVLDDALAAAGLAPRYRAAAALERRGDVFVIVTNDADGVTLSQQVTLDLVVTGLPDRRFEASDRMMRDLPRTQGFASF